MLDFRSSSNSANTLAVVKLSLYTRRNPDSTQRQHAISTAKLISGILLDHLKWQATGEQLGFR